LIDQTTVVTAAYVIDQGSFFKLFLGVQNLSKLKILLSNSTSAIELDEGVVYRTSSKIIKVYYKNIIDLTMNYFFIFFKMLA